MVSFVFGVGLVFGLDNLRALVVPPRNNFFTRLYYFGLWYCLITNFHQRVNKFRIFFSLTLLCSSIQIFTEYNICLKSDQSAWSIFHSGCGLYSENL